MPDRPYHHGALRDALVAAALLTAEQRGPTALSVRALAKQTGVSPSAVYRHFPSLEHVVADVSQLARERLAVALERARRSAPGPVPGGRRLAMERMRAVGRAYVQFGLDSPRLFELAFVACSVAPSRPDDPSAWDVLGSSLDELIADGLLEPGRKEQAAMVAWSAVHGLASIVARGISPLELAPSSTIETVLDAIEVALRG